MRRSNVKVRAWLNANNYKDISFFPHTRFIKDLHFQDLDFDGMASIDITLVLFQVKSNVKISKQTLEDYRSVSKKFGIKCMWFNVVDNKGVEVYE